MYSTRHDREKKEPQKTGRARHELRREKRREWKKVSRTQFPMQDEETATGQVANPQTLTRSEGRGERTRKKQGNGKQRRCNREKAGRPKCRSKREGEGKKLRRSGNTCLSISIPFAPSPAAVCSTIANRIDSVFRAHTLFLSLFSPDFPTWFQNLPAARHARTHTHITRLRSGYLHGWLITHTQPSYPRLLEAPRAPFQNP